ncbi:hypothetical protein OEZ86_013819 [Tetradesmus obliquus]|nr:hypothetical protein OEZ86_013819 [Tetradesmus obliquus]
MYSLPPHDDSQRCQRTGICDGDYSCGPDGLGCVTSAKQRQEHVRKAISWSWEGYRKYAWGSDEVDVINHTPKAWFNLGLTIVDSLDTLIISGLNEEYQQARHWVANHLEFKDGSKVQFFEVNIRILGGLLSAYYLSGGDDMYLQKAEMLADRLMVSFNTTRGMPSPFATFGKAAARAATPITDVKTNVAEAGTLSMEFTTIGRLLGRQDMSDAGMRFWQVLAGSRNFSGLYCMGLHTKDASCTDPKMTIGSAADSMYEYMLKQWVLSGGTQQLPLELYNSSMQGVRKHLVRHIWDGTAEMSFVSEATVSQASGVINPTNDRFEHLTCFAGGMFVLGKLHNISTTTTPEDFDDITLGARIGRACYELYHQAPSGLAPDSVHYNNKAGGNLPSSVSQRRSAARKLAGAAAAAAATAAAASAPAASTRQLLADTAPAPQTAPTSQQQVQNVPLSTQPAAAAAAASNSTPPRIIASWNQLSKADFLRPEAIETLFYLWRATGDQIYREWGWNMFRAFERYCRVESGGYATVADVNLVPPKLAPKMESFWLAETLKYFYLLFENDLTVLPLDQWVFNTEAHPLPVWGSPADVQAMQQLKQRQQAAAQEKQRLEADQAASQEGLHTSVMSPLQQAAQIRRVR